jgi:hypothetical protein
MELGRDLLANRSGKSMKPAQLQLVSQGMSDILASAWTTRSISNSLEKSLVSDVFTHGVN